MSETETSRRAPETGAPRDRVDGRLKVTGTAKYSAEIALSNVAHAVLVTSTVPVATIAHIDAVRARSAPGVLAVLTHENAPKLPPQKLEGQSRVLTLLQDNEVRYNGQPVAVVVADTLEHATDAASLVTVRYATRRTPVIDMHGAKDSAYMPKPSNNRPPDTKRGDVDAALANAAVKLRQTYTTPFEHHNPMEMHSTTAAWDGDKLTVYDATQYVVGDRDLLAKTLGVPPENVRLLSYFVGGGFGSKGSMWSHVPLTAMAAKAVKRPVRLMLTRRQMFGPVGGRPQTEQTISIGAAKDGTIGALRHESVSHTSRFDEFLEPAAMVTRVLYASPNLDTSHRLVRLDTGTPIFQRAPGEATGTFALESAMDEMAVALDMDPIAFRLKNYAEREPESGKPFSSKALRECYRVGAERFNWSKRNPKPRANRDGNVLVGHGMASCTYPTNRMKASASARLMVDGDSVRALVQTATQDIGTGTYTVMAQVAADALALPMEQVRFELGDSRMPPSPVSGGSMTAASSGSAVHDVCLALRNRLVSLAVSDDASPLRGANASDVVAENGVLVDRRNGSQRETYVAVLKRQPGAFLEVQSDSAPAPEAQQYAMHSFGAVFVEARVDEDLGEIRIPRVVAAYGVGRILNMKTALSQLHGGIVWGVGMAMLEETLIDHASGRYANADLGEYHVPVNADIGALDVTFVPETDTIINPIGVKGIGEIGITGVAAAIANAVYNATGVRVRSLPITLDKITTAATAS